jgi:hypothetical protein
VLAIVIDEIKMMGSPADTRTSGLSGRFFGRLTFT